MTPKSVRARRPGKPGPSLPQRLKKIRCLLMDVDGVLTDGKLHVTGDGQESKTFDVQDGHGIVLAQRAGLIVGLVSARPSPATTRRAADLGVKIVLQEQTDKREMVDRIKRDHGLTDEQICFVGDELVDLPVLRRAGVAVAVSNATDEVKQSAHYVTRRHGGDGAIREVVELILKAQGSWRPAIAKYLTLIIAGLFLAAGPTIGNEGVTGFIEKFEVPERDQAGNLRWKLAGDKAQIGADGLMDIVNMRAEFYTSNKVDLVFTSPTCRLDQIKKRATTVSPVTIERDNMVVTGVGADWNGEQSSFVIHHDVRVVLKGTTSLFSEAGKKP